MKIGYAGSNANLAEFIIRSDKFELEAVICEKHRVNKELVLMCEFYNIVLYIIKDKYHLCEVIKKINCDKYLMYNFGIIVPENILEVYDFYNIHPGCLKLYRGRNPIEKAILNNEKSIIVTLYKVSSKIDLGEVISEYKIDILFYDDNITIEKKICKLFSKFINDLYLNFIYGSKIYSVNEGVYLDKIKVDDYSIDIMKDSITDIYNKIKSQRKYQGALLNYDNVKYRVIDIYDIKLNEASEYNKITLHKDKLIFNKDKYIITLIIKKVV